MFSCVAGEFDAVKFKNKLEKIKTKIKRERERTFSSGNKNTASYPI